MIDKYQNKYRITSARLQSWDYGANGAYFITICTKNREHFFGEILNNKMQLNELGQLTEKYWVEIPTHFPFIELGNFVVMPNHTHGILIIDKPDIRTDDVETPKLGVSTTNAPTTNTNAPATTIITSIITSTKTSPKTSPTNPTTPIATPTPTTPIIGGKNEKWKPNTIGTIINQFKRIVTINARKINADFAWQSRFHDHIIRDAQSFENIQNYIANNPANWAKDKFSNNG